MMQFDAKQAVQDIKQAYTLTRSTGQFMNNELSIADLLESAESMGQMPQYGVQGQAAPQAGGVAAPPMPNPQQAPAQPMTEAAPMGLPPPDAPQIPSPPPQMGLPVTE